MKEIPGIASKGEERYKVRGTTANSLLGIMNHHLFANGTSFTDGEVYAFDISADEYGLRKIRVRGPMPSRCFQIFFFFNKLLVYLAYQCFLPSIVSL